MDPRALRDFVNNHPDGVVIRMVDGHEYRVPHRDFVWFTPTFGTGPARAGGLTTSFWLHDAEHDETRLINALVVREVSPLGRNGHGGERGKKRAKRR